MFSRKEIHIKQMLFVQISFWKKSIHLINWLFFFSKLQNEVFYWKQNAQNYFGVLNLSHEFGWVSFQHKWLAWIQRIILSTGRISTHQPNVCCQCLCVFDVNFHLNSSPRFFLVLALKCTTFQLEMTNLPPVVIFLPTVIETTASMVTMTKVSPF